MTGNLPDTISPIEALFLDGLQDVIGRQGIVEFTHLANPDYSPAAAHLGPAEIQAALEANYGTFGGQGIAYRAGRAAASKFFRDYGQVMGLNDLGVRLLSPKKRIKAGLMVLAQSLSGINHETYQVSEEKDAWIMEAQACPFCMGRHLEKPACFFMAGLLQEFVATLSRGKIYSVVETDCLSVGAQACVFRINRQILD